MQSNFMYVFPLESSIFTRRLKLFADQKCEMRCRWSTTSLARIPSLAKQWELLLPLATDPTETA